MCCAGRGGCGNARCGAAVCGAVQGWVGLQRTFELLCLVLMRHPASFSCVARPRTHALLGLELMRRQASRRTRTGLAWVQVPMRCNKKGAEKVKQNGKAGGEG